MHAPLERTLPDPVKSRKSTHAHALFAWPTPAQVGKWLERSEQVGDCLIWTGSLTADGYPRVSFNGKTQLLHRIAYAFWRGPIPHGHDAHHIDACTSRACWNPDHVQVRESREHRLMTLTVWSAQGWE